jgi:inner membrane protein
MDPLTQGLLGAAAAHVACGRRLGPRALLVGGLGGVLPDADVFIRSASDPLLAVEMHRQFTHALAFIPIGGSIAALPWVVRKRNRALRKTIAGAAIVGYATHGLLDACTTYGTQLLWPFSDARIAWDAISVIDPIFTLTLLLGTIAAWIVKSSRPAAVALVLCLVYLLAGGLQRGRASGVQEQLAAARGHAVSRGKVFPTIGNNLVWRSLYRSGDTLYVDRIRVPWFGAARFSPGTSVRSVGEEDLAPDEKSVGRVVEDFRRFQWFSDGWLARDTHDPSVIGDVRYSMRTDAFDAIWGIRFHPERALPTEWVSRSRDRTIDLRDVRDEITGRHPAYRAIAAGPPPR